MKEEPDFASYHTKLVSTYDERNYDRSLAGRFMRQSHRLLEKPFGPDVTFEKVLEVASGRGEHLAYVRHGFREYHMTDLSTEMLESAPQGRAVPDGSRVIVSRCDATSLKYPDGAFDRLIATHVLEHLYRPHEVLREWDRVVRPGGVLSIVLPCDPGLLWRLGRNLGPRASATKHGIAYDYWMAREHVNPIGNLVTFIEHYFDRVDAAWYPARIPVVDLNLFYICNVTK